MTIEELKSIVKAEIAEQREIEEICENTTHYYVFFKAKSEWDTGAIGISVDKITKKIKYEIGYGLPKDLVKIA